MTKKEDIEKLQHEVKMANLKMWVCFGIGIVLWPFLIVGAVFLYQKILFKQALDELQE